MILKAHVEDGQIVTDGPLRLADGTQLLVSLAPTVDELRRSRERLIRHAGVDTEPTADSSTRFEDEMYRRDR